MEQGICVCRKWLTSSLVESRTNCSRQFNSPRFSLIAWLSNALNLSTVPLGSVCLCDWLTSCYLRAVSAASTVGYRKRLHDAHRVFAALVAQTDPEAQDLYQRMRTVYNQMHPSSSSPIPPFEEWQGVHLFCSNPVCRCASVQETMQAPFVHSCFIVCSLSKILMCIRGFAHLGFHLFSTTNAYQAANGPCFLRYIIIDCSLKFLVWIRRGSHLKCNLSPDGFIGPFLVYWFLCSF